MTAKSHVKTLLFRWLYSLVTIRLILSWKTLCQLLLTTPNSAAMSAENGQHNGHITNCLVWLVSTVQWNGSQVSFCSVATKIQHLLTSPRFMQLTYQTWLEWWTDCKKSVFLHNILWLIWRNSAYKQRRWKEVTLCVWIIRFRLYFLVHHLIYVQAFSPPLLLQALRWKDFKSRYVTVGKMNRACYGFAIAN